MIEKECTHVLNTDMATQDVLPLINPNKPEESLAAK